MGHNNLCNYDVGFLFAFKAWQQAHSRLCNRCATLKTAKKTSNIGGLFIASCLNIGIFQTHFIVSFYS